MNKDVKLSGLIIKGISAIFVGWILLGLIFFSIEELYNSRENSTTTLNRCYQYYNERDFDGMFLVLRLHDTYDERFDVYWEALNAYNEYNAYIQWQKASLAGVEDAEEMADKSLDKLEEMADKPKCENNKKLLNDFVNKAHNYMNQINPNININQ